MLKAEDAMEIGIQVSSLKPMLTTEAEVRTAFEKMAAMGCRTVQLQWIDPGVSIDFIARALADTGLRSVSVQDYYQTIAENRSYYYTLNQKTGGTWMCVSRVPERLRTRPGLDEYVQELRQMAAELDAIGQKVCFHPVFADYQPIDGICPVEYLMDRMPELSLCIDLYHLNKAGKSMPQWLRRWAGRVCMVHFKEGRHMPDGSEQLVPAGQGGIDWTGVVPACLETGVPYAFAEQERWDRDPFVCLGEAMDWLKARCAQP